MTAFAFGCREEARPALRSADEIGHYDDLFAVSVVDATHVVAVGYFGSVYVSDDAGVTWTPGRAPTERSLYSVSMANARVGWSVGQYGTLLRTVDGGRSWYAQQSPLQRAGHLFGVQALDAETAIAVGEWGARIYTEDGGNTWRDDSLRLDEDHPQFVWLAPGDRERVRAGEVVYEDVSLHDVSCRRESGACWIVGEFGYVFRSVDRGRSWLRAEIVEDSHFAPIRFATGEAAPTPADAARLAAFAESLVGAPHLDVRVEAFTSEREIQELHGRETPGPIFELISARLDGARGLLEAAGLPADRIRILHAPPWDLEEFAEGDSASLGRYLDARRARDASLVLSEVQNPVLFTVRFADRSEGFISGLGGVVLRSEDAGATWRDIASGSRDTWFSVAASGARVVTVGEKGRIAVSADGGRHWAAPHRSRAPATSGYMRDVEFSPSDPSVGFAVGRRGTILRTSDAGDSWFRVLPALRTKAG